MLSVRFQYVTGLMWSEFAGINYHYIITEEILPILTKKGGGGNVQICEQHKFLLEFTIQRCFNGP